MVLGFKSDNASLIMAVGWLRLTRWRVAGDSKSDTVTHNLSVIFSTFNLCSFIYLKIFRQIIYHQKMIRNFPR